MSDHSSALPAFDPRSITRPSPVLWRYYLLTSLLLLAAGPFVLLVFYFKYKSLRYSFDEKGVSMRWGVLFRREISLTYRRIQDIHVSRNLLQRWLGLASVSIQTASGNAGAEMTIEGIHEYEALRDYLYSRMRGAHGDDEPAAPSADDEDEALRLLREIRDELRQRRVHGEAQEVAQ